MAAIGTVSHELGHVAADYAVGGSAVLHYASATPVGIPDGDFYRGITVAGGPLQTVLTGSLGLLALWWLPRTEMPPKKWLAVLAAAFWSREPFNMLAGFAFYARTGHSPTRGDEYRLATMLDLNPWALQIPLGLLGIAACTLILFWIPKDWRLPLIVGGTAANVFGFAMWMGVLGPALLP